MIDMSDLAGRQFTVDDLNVPGGHARAWLAWQQHRNASAAQALAAEARQRRETRQQALSTTGAPPGGAGAPIANLATHPFEMEDVLDDGGRGRAWAAWRLYGNDSARRAIDDVGRAVRDIANGGGE